ncbi:hypothetical protein B4N89_47100 [Embleya scabrispora]|uniref:Uncharacterized protein n=1 Tax=Embleya scabrispora TaxID=159449 RepID=A0A1T3NIM8_9ACTN|nr:hypothetical protein B4N89_47100 [Embleya scabrispora]
MVGASAGRRPKIAPTLGSGPGSGTSLPPTGSPRGEQRHAALRTGLAWSPGRYSFRHSGPAGGRLRPLHDPAETGDDDEPDE